ncbi:HAMP domain-containing sensor histidine kinase [Streptomyces sp. S.PB5]|uniref:sensor histidine kinase n=1 Tax=Streptomyces sp. S.PB5 TaxID=3020844 RepID=UPI0025B13A75|nr:HAMP domain-containing sensor histidine kinase [Streptomyces sp. S.PB5]MDN3027534.1 HAMP domain-containing sensor histidine kinase [Streptomyces sp. S.PB5]
MSKNRWRRPWTLRARLVAALLVLAALGLGAIGAASVVMIRDSMIARMDNQLRVLVQQVDGRPGQLKPSPEDRRNSTGLPTEFALHVLYTNGKPELSAQLPTAGPALPVINSTTVDRYEEHPFTVADKQGGGDWRVVVSRREMADGQRIIVAAQSTETTEATVTQLIWIEIGVGTALLLIVGGVGFLLVLLGLRPLTKIEKTAEDIAGGNLELRVASDAHTEVGRLGGALNTMLSRLSSALRQRERSEERLRRFVADASHELNTPLTSIRGFAELNRCGGAPDRADVDRLMVRIEDEAIRMSRLVDDMLLLARLDQERALDLVELDICTLVEDAVHDAGARDPERPLILESTEKPIRVTVDEHRMRQVITNLVSNAMAHTPPSTPVHVRVGMPVTVPEPPVAVAGSLEPGSRVVLEVVDQGPGVPLEAAPNIFDRFYRVDEARSRSRGGTGLGLAITAAILGAHGGRVELRTAPGEGARFTVLLP